MYIHTLLVSTVLKKAVHSGAHHKKKLYITFSILYISTCNKPVKYVEIE